MNPNDIIKPENLVYARPRLLDERNTHYCPGCSHGVVHRLLAELIDEMGLEDKTIGVAPVGCAVVADNYIDVDWVEAARKICIYISGRRRPRRNRHSRNHPRRQSR